MPEIRAPPPPQNNPPRTIQAFPGENPVGRSTTHSGPSGPETEGKSIRKAAQAETLPPHKKRRALKNGGFLRGWPS